MFDEPHSKYRVYSPLTVIGLIIFLPCSLAHLWHIKVNALSTLPTPRPPLININVHNLLMKIFTQKLILSIKMFAHIKINAQKNLMGHIIYT